MNAMKRVEESALLGSGTASPNSSPHLLLIRPEEVVRDFAQFSVELRVNPNGFCQVPRVSQDLAGESRKQTIETDDMVDDATCIAGRLYESENCSAARALELVGEHWSLLTFRNASFAGQTRFSEFERSLGIAPNILASRLESFVVAGLMEARPNAEHKGAERLRVDRKGSRFRAGPLSP